MHKNISISLILIISLFSFSGCTMTMPDGTIHDVGVAQKIGSFIYKPVYSKEQIGVNTVTKEKITGYKVVTVTNSDGTTETIKEPIIEIVTFDEPVFKDVVTDWKPNLLGKALELGLSAIPIPGADEAAGAAILIGALGMGTQELFRRRKKKITDSEASDKEKEIAIAKAEKDATQEHLQVSVGAMKDFMKTDAGKAVKKEMKEAFLKKATDFGIAKRYKTAIKIVKAII